MYVYTNERMYVHTNERMYKLQLLKTIYFSTASKDKFYYIFFYFILFFFENNRKSHQLHRSTYCISVYIDRQVPVYTFFLLFFLFLLKAYFFFFFFYIQYCRHCLLVPFFVTLLACCVTFAVLYCIQCELAVLCCSSPVHCLVALLVRVDFFLYQYFSSVVILLIFLAYRLSFLQVVDGV